MRVLQLFADHPCVYDKLRQEILDVAESEGKGDTLNSNKVMALLYLEAVYRETLGVQVKHGYLLAVEWTVGLTGYPGVTTLLHV